MVESRYFADDGDIERMKRTKGSAGATLKDPNYTYDRNGNRTTDERGTHLFNARQQLVRWTRAKGPKAGSSVKYTPNGAGAVVEEVDEFGDDTTTTYTYEGDRLTEATASQDGALDTTATYGYDPNGFGNLERISQEGASARSMATTRSGG